MQRTVSRAAVMSTAPFLIFATRRRDSANADPTCRAGAVMSVSLRPSACSRGGAVFLVTATPLGLNHSTVKRADSVGASRASRDRSVTAVLTATSSSKKEGAQPVTVLTWVITVILTLANASALPIPLERNVQRVHQTPGATASSQVVRLVTAAQRALGTPSVT